MNEQDYTASLTLNATPHDVFEHINNVTAWWTDDLEGHSHQLNDEFTVRFDDIHVSTQKVVELIPDQKVTWLVTDSKLTFVEQQHEWTNTTISFELSTLDNKTHLQFTHFGLVPSVQCYTGCTKGWDYYVKGSLCSLLTEGKGTPGL
ncbi:SRPBCC domain-containing protein [Spirosoma sp. KCTC 42546]|uniref:SRPBCC family protein n=1 Tax=Spirosoma sp. KCTC 42546 TaxID=2520506 RepID=UPI00115BB68F|nr:SRPBCC domain-containing protein [Spirosoma sp. KCTC 42546]QDK78738.1 SRPBCC domain-containing protein [Spirosoma sp. KCTC 42546]